MLIPFSWIDDFQPSIVDARLDDARSKPFRLIYVSEVDVEPPVQKWLAGYPMLIQSCQQKVNMGTRSGRTGLADLGHGVPVAPVTSYFVGWHGRLPEQFP
ncbi:hypothetical protein [Paraburkholderia caledonica]|uniref:hypothetical protein n=1 Tax=Paraburkholderia caledonica TaxID=134536 RepID=UPI0038BD9B53